MTDRKERQHVIKVLKNMLDWMEAANKINSTPERIEAVKYAIASIETDLKYDLLYEETSGQADKSTTKNDLVVDAVRRKAVLNTLDNMDSALDEDDRTVETYKELLKECYKVLPSVTLIRPKGHWIPIYQGDEIIDYRCSECEFGNTFGKGTFGIDFCPRCGSDNREVEE